MFEGKKILILDLIIFTISFVFVFFLSNTNFITNFIVWVMGWSAVALIHEAGHSFVCAVSGGFPLVLPGTLGGQFTLVTHCYSFGLTNLIVDSIITIFGIVFECISIFVLFYLAAATNEKTWTGMSYSFISSSFAWISVGLLQREINNAISGSDISRIILTWGMSLNTIITSITAFTMILAIMAIRYGLEEEQKSGKINVINLDILPLEISYANLFKFLFFILCTFLAVNVLVLLFKPNLIGVVIAFIIIAFAIYFHNVYKVGNKFRHIISKIKINLKEVKASFSLLSALFQCTTEKNVVFSIIHRREGWVVNVPSKDISVKLPNYVSEGDVAERMNKIFRFNKLL